MTEPLTRRTLLRAGGGITVMGAGALVLAACSPTTGSGDSLSAADDAPDGGALPAGTTVAALADIPVGGTKAVTVKQTPMLLAQPTAGKVVCFSAICTHQGCVVSAAAKEFDCPCHGSRFDAATGKVLQGPAVSPLNAIKVTVSGDSVVTA